MLVPRLAPKLTSNSTYLKKQSKEIFSDMQAVELFDLKSDFEQFYQLTSRYV